MAVSDLTNTAWAFNNIISVEDLLYNSKSINFNYNGTSYTSIIATFEQASSTGPEIWLYRLYFDSTIIASGANSSQVVMDNQTIEITGGDDVRNDTLITWLEANATQQSIVSLANTKWRFKDNPDLSSFSAAGTSYSIAFVSNATNYTLLKLASTSIAYNTTTVYTGTTPLTAPSIALSSDIVTITDNDGNATGFKVYWNDSTDVAETITKTS